MRNDSVPISEYNPQRTPFQILCLRERTRYGTEPFRASVIDVSKDSLTVQITGESDKIEAFIELIKPYGIKELARTGTAAIPRGMQIAHAKSATIV